MRYCIYLKKAEPKVSFSSEEHIFPAGIGGIQKLPLEYVSHDCNNSFSVMELQFMRNSLISIPRQFYGPGKRGNLNPKRATKSTVSLMNEDINPEILEFGYISLGKPYSISQLKVNKDGQCQFISDSSMGDTNKQTADFMKNLTNFNGKYSLQKDKRISDDEFIIGYHDGKWYVALSNEDLKGDISSFVSDFLEQAPFEKQPPVFQTIQPRVHQSIQVDDSFFRVCAKIVFNYLAFSKGQNFVLQSCFDPLRSWIISGGNNKFANLLQEKIPLPFSLPELAHKIIITQSHNSLIGIVSFYGNEFGTLIRLCDNFESQFQLDGFICDWKNRREYQLIDYINLLE